MDFDGFPRDTLDFLEDLEEHNDREWFKDHKARYEVSWKGAGVDFAEAMAPHLSKLDPPGQVDARIHGNLFRIHRDTRFSKDKTPYKTNLAMWFWCGATKKTPAAGYYLSISPDGVAVGGGAYQFDKPELERFREAVAGEAGEALAALVSDAATQGWSLGGAALKRVPRGYDKDHPHADLLKQKGLYLSGTEPLGDWLHGPEVTDRIAARFAETCAFNRWLQAHVFRG